MAGSLYGSVVGCSERDSPLTAAYLKRYYWGMQHMSRDASELFRTNVAALLREQEHTITEMAETLGLARPSLSRVLSGKEGITLERAQKIAEFLGVTVAELLSEKKFAKTA